MELSADLLLLALLGTFLPLVVTAFTKWEAPDWVKNLVNLGLAGLVAGVQTGIDSLEAGEDWTWKGAASAWLVTWLLSSFAYMKLWKNNPLSVKVGAATAGFGVDGPLGPTSKPAPPPEMAPHAAPYPDAAA